MEESSMASAAESHIPMEFSSNVKKLLGAYIPLELQLLSALVTLLLFLFLLISILWDQYGKEIGELYSSPMGTVVQGKKTSAPKATKHTADTVYNVIDCAKSTALSSGRNTNSSALAIALRMESNCLRKRLVTTPMPDMMSTIGNT
ncbi:hypothetical protein PsorP6_002683 [Peronosclerospora sorghi]|uniref:Uncharacterized protein n=1 Tax=Peronosclerospora sorghi TaxID=230839 RepID=A0ACC0WXP2_9STRA|nr:hypothetical protein PsorP6_002683 [Peronosclerospora sorghi]